MPSAAISTSRPLAEPDKRPRTPIVPSRPERRICSPNSGNSAGKVASGARTTLEMNSRSAPATPGGGQYWPAGSGWNGRNCTCPWARKLLLPRQTASSLSLADFSVACPQRRSRSGTPEALAPPMPGRRKVSRSAWQTRLPS